MFEVEVLNIEELKRRPQIHFINDTLNKLIIDKNIQIDVSISHIKETAIAMAVVEE